MQRPTIGVMGGAAAVLNPADLPRFEELATTLGEHIAKLGCVLITGATTGVTHMASAAAKKAGGFTIGISPAASLDEHVNRYKLPVDASSTIIYTGFGLKGRNVINVRSSDIVIIFGGSIGTLNEFTIAYDEGKIIGALAGTGGAADNIQQVLQFCNKPSSSRLHFEEDPVTLVDACIKSWASVA